MNESLALTRTRARRRPRKPPGEPPFWPWWFSGLCALMSLVVTFRALLRNETTWAAFNGALFCVNGHQAIRRWQWDRYNRWKGGRS